MDTLLQDIRYGIRMLRKSPAFTTVAVITLALGIGANTAIFSIVNAVLLRPLPFPQPDRLMFLTEMVERPSGPMSMSATSYPDFFDWRSQNHGFKGIAAYHDNDFTLTGTGQPLHVSGQTVSAGFFSVLGIEPMLGRGFLPEEEKPGSRVVVLSQSLWQSVYGSDRNIVGRNITVNQQSYQVVGVMPPGFTFPLDADPPKLWRTIAVDAEVTTPGDQPVTQQRGAHFLQAVARLKDGTTVDQAREEMNLIAQSLAKQYPNTNKRHSAAAVMPELEHLVGDHRPALIILIIVVGCVLLIACVNVANLLLARAGSRGREIAVRAALGAARIRVVRQLMTESFLLSLGGTIFAIPLASWAVKLFLNLNAANLPRMTANAIDGQVLAFTLAIAVLTSFLFGLVPALRSSSPNLLHFMKDGGRGGSTGTSHQRLRSVLVVAETAIGLILLVTAGLLLRSFHRLTHVDPGFNPKNVLTFNFDLFESKYPAAQQTQFYNQFLQRLKTLPGVVSAAGVTPLPLSNNNMVITFQIEGHPVPRADEPFADIRFASPEYFRTVGIPLISGRDFTERDDMKSNRVVIINQAFAKKFFPDENPIGKHIKAGVDDDKAPPREVVGVVGNVKHRRLSAEFTPEYYIPYMQNPGWGMTICLRTVGDPASLTAAAKKELSTLDRDLPMYDVRTLESYVSASVAQPHFQALLLEAFAFLALVLTAIGIYGVIAYSVVQRTQEIGIRMTLGATQNQVMSMVLKAGVRLTASGVLVGIVFALGLTRWLESINNLLFQVKSTDLLTFVSVVAILAAVSLLASYIPARRAMKVDPIVALRYE